MDRIWGWLSRWAAWLIVAALIVLGLALVALKWLHVVAWPWSLVLSPFLLLALVLGAAVVIACNWALDDHAL